jgi:iron(II)-dependent oxidoreductase
MRLHKRTLVSATISVVGIGGVVFGWLVSRPAVMVAAVMVIVANILGLLWRVGMGRRHSKPPRIRASSTARAISCTPVDSDDTRALVEEMLAQGREALLLRPQIACNLSDQQFQRAKEALLEAMALVPDGEVFLQQMEPEEDDSSSDPAASPRGRVVPVVRFFLDRYPVTNRQYYQFVAAGGYEQISYWDQAIWPEVLEFVDQTGRPGPRFWREGCYEPGLENHPVVGVSWHEAAAYARWAGKRLPSDAEWVKAASWPVKLGPDARSQRRYPWGEVMDRSRANLWSSGLRGTAPVDQFAGGVSVGGVYQLVGNVWEWTRGNYGPSDHPRGDLVLDVPLKSIRGGAFDTYFDSQATCQFHSGDVPGARKRNIGFRCAVGVCDLLLARPARPSEPDAIRQPDVAEEVQV